MNRSESKYFATAARMDEAFLELIGKKDFAYITVKEICERAGVNRSTFYLHYETVSDLLAESAQFLIDRMMSYMPTNTVDFLRKIQDAPLEELYLMTPEYLLPYLRFIRDHRRIFRTSVEQASVLRMDDAYRDLNRYILTPILNRFGVPQEEQKYLLRFCIGGLMAIISEWLKDDCRDSDEKIAAMMQRCIGQLRS